MIHATAPGMPPSILESEVTLLKSLKHWLNNVLQVATLDYLRENTSIKVPRILQTHYDGAEHIRPYIVLEKVQSKLDE